MVLVDFFMECQFSPRQDLAGWIAGGTLARQPAGRQRYLEWVSCSHIFRGKEKTLYLVMRPPARSAIFNNDVIE
jgi:hypothetical protein